tara:strand:- start:151 stop:762 length:612 start_codon:yes stop_codon:yes gene_type:complete
MSQEKIAFVLGNGLSRKPIDPHLLKQHGRIYGCNALYRTFAPDYLVAVDTKMIMEIQKTDYAHKHQVWSNPNKLTKADPNLNIFNPNKGWSSGPTALFLASTHDNAKIYILGFDYVGIGNNHELVNNIYAGTKNYKNLNDRATYHGNWQRQTASCINQFVRTKYIRVIEEDSYIPDNLVDCKNLKHMSTRIFCKTFGITPSKS